jgi:secreted PhoX family phosphatase
MGAFKHEAAAVDPLGKHVYMTEDLIDGGFYRFAPDRWPDLSSGVLEIARIARDGTVRWLKVPDPSAGHTATRDQLSESSVLKRAEGIWNDQGTVYIATTADHRVHAYDIRRQRIKVIYDGLASASAPLLRVDAVTANRAGEVFVCEDIATTDKDIGMIDRRRRVSRFLTATGPRHAGSEMTGVTFDPSGSRMYFSSQRALGSSGEPGPGEIYEVAGPFHGSHAFHRRDQAA